MLQSGFTKRLLQVAAMVVGLWLLWTLTSAWLILFGAILVAVLLTTLSGIFCRRFGLGSSLALTVSLALVVGVLALAFYLFGQEVAAQFVLLQRQLPSAIARAEEWARGTGLLDEAVAQARGAIPSAGQVMGVLGGFVGGVFGAVSNVALAIVGGIYIAADPQGHVRGFLLLWPKERRPYVEETVRTVGRALKGWLKAQLVAMLVIGSLTTLGLWIIGSPSFLALGVIAGITQFIPLAGPILAAIPAILVALVQGPQMLLYTAILYVAIQQLEGNVITPLVQREVASLPPSLTIFTLVIFGLLFGVVGVVLAVPLTVVLYTLVMKLWVRDYVGEPVPLPGERDTAKA